MSLANDRKSTFWVKLRLNRDFTILQVPTGSLVWYPSIEHTWSLFFRVVIAYEKWWSEIRNVSSIGMFFGISNEHYVYGRIDVFTDPTHSSVVNNIDNDIVNCWKVKVLRRDTIVEVSEIPYSEEWIASCHFGRCL